MSSLSFAFVLLFAVALCYGLTTEGQLKEATKVCCSQKCSPAQLLKIEDLLTLYYSEHGQNEELKLNAGQIVTGRSCSKLLPKPVGSKKASRINRRSEYEPPVTFDGISLPTMAIAHNTLTVNVSLSSITDIVSAAITLVREGGTATLAARVVFNPIWPFRFEATFLTFYSLTPGRYCANIDVITDLPGQYKFNNVGCLDFVDPGCVPGQYVTRPGLQCVTCPRHTFAGSYNSEACYPCPAGSWAGLGYSICDKACPPGASLQSGSCVDCIAGYYTSVKNTASCRICPSGTFNTAVGSVSCPSCPSGSIAYPASTSCSVCPAGTFAVNDVINGVAYCADCAHGWYSPASSVSCSACPANTYSGVKAGSCTSCPSGYTSPTTSGSCCPEGTSNSTGVCTDCAPGSYAPIRGLVQCSVCPAGKYSSTYHATSCTDCPTGSIAYPNSASCSVCPAGTFAVNDVAGGVAYCADCSAGWYSAQSSTVCSPCPANTYSLRKAGSCTACPAGTSSAPQSGSCQ